MQTGDGGLAPWPGQDTSWPYGSVYGAHFLVEAQRSRPQRCRRTGSTPSSTGSTRRSGPAAAAPTRRSCWRSPGGRPARGSRCSPSGRRPTRTAPGSRRPSCGAANSRRRARCSSRRSSRRRPRAPAPARPTPIRPPPAGTDDVLSFLFAASASARGADVGATRHARRARVAAARRRDPARRARRGEPRRSARVAGSSPGSPRASRTARTTQEDATVLLALVHHEAKVRGAAGPANGRLVVGGREVAFRGGATLEVGPGRAVDVVRRGRRARHAGRPRGGRPDRRRGRAPRAGHDAHAPDGRGRGRIRPRADVPRRARGHGAGRRGGAAARRRAARRLRARRVAAGREHAPPEPRGGPRRPHALLPGRAARRRDVPPRLPRARRPPRARSRLPAAARRAPVRPDGLRPGGAGTVVDLA